MTDPISPLRYPGGKAVLADYFEEIIKENLLLGCTLVEPYAGGASISLSMLSRGAVSKVVLVERDPLLYAFWKSSVLHTDEFCQRIQRLSVTLRTWKAYQRYLVPSALQKYSTLELGLAGLFFNRANFSGILHAKPIGGMSQSSRYSIDCRFNKKRIIDLIRRVGSMRSNITVRNGDALKYLERNQRHLNDGHTFVYIDPPYYQQGPRLYRYHYSYQDHCGLAEYMDRKTYPWVVSIDNHPDIRSLYANQKIVPIFLNYVVKKSRKAEELLISNLQFQPPVYEDEFGREVIPVLDEAVS